MSSPIPPLVRQLLTGARKSVRDSLRRARPGSILILVVALLVLVAIIGTAALSTNTIDRYATAQNNANTQIDLLVEGIKNMSKAVLVGDLQGLDFSGKNVYRPEGGLTYDHWDMPLLIDLTNRPTGMRPELFAQLKQANDAWLSPRYPDQLFPHVDAANPAAPSTMVFDPTSYGANPPVWDSIGAPLENTNGVPTSGQFLFDTPGVFTAANTLDATAARGYNNRITDRRNAQTSPPTPVVNYLTPRTIAYQTSNGTFTAPAWFLNGKYYIAADADGDGIADAGLKRINVGDINGLTYYYAVRIIDNGSAINVNTAHTRDHEFLGDSGDGQGTQAMSSRAGVAVPQQANIFPSSIGLAELLRTSNSGTATSLTQLQFGGGTLNEIGRIDDHRFNGNRLPSGVVTNQLAGTALPNDSVVVDDYNNGTMSTRQDFAYNTIGEFLHFGLGRRMGYPGVVAAPNTRFNPFGVSESAALAYHFVLANPDASRSTLENATVLGTQNANATANFDSLYYGAGNVRRDRPAAFPSMVGSKEYPKSDAGLGYWFADNFAWNGEYTGTTEAPVQYRNRRAMFTADNPVSNQVPTPAGLTLGAVTKASVNTATFNDLFNAYFNVMAEGGGDSPYRSDGATATQKNAPPPEEMYLYTGMRFAASIPTDQGTLTPNPTDTQQPSSFLQPQGGDTNIDRMFRNVIRDNTTAVIGDRGAKYDDATNKMNPPTDSKSAAHIQPKQMRRLRAFLAAANTVSMRHPLRRYVPFVMRATDPTYASNPMVVRINDADSPVDLITYAAEPQPFITEVYVNTDTNRAPGEYDTTDPVALSLGRNDEPYVAIELFYPYKIENTTIQPSGQPWDLRPWGTQSGWLIQMIDRTGVRTNGRLPAAINIGSITSGQTDAFFDLPQTADPRMGSYIILENFNENSASPAAEKVKYRPRSSGLPYNLPLAAWHNGSTTLPPIKSVYVKDLAKLIKAGQTTTDIGGELLICRPVPPVAGVVMPPRPIDSFDFTGMENQTASGTAWTMHYCRQGRTVAGTGEWWSFVYPGRYDGGIVSGTAGVTIGRRQQGMQLGKFNNKSPAVPNDPADPNWPLAPGNYDPFDFALRSPFEPLDPKVTLGGEYQNAGVGWVAQPSDNASAKASYPNTFKTQLLAADQPGWNPVGGYPSLPAPNKFPFGAFARNTDIMQIPYFAAYRIKPASPGVGTPFDTSDIEINSISMDASYCEDTDPFDDESNVATALVVQGFNTYEQLGRFCPVSTLMLASFPLGAYTVDDLDPGPANTYRYYQPDDPAVDPNTGISKRAWRYRWATRLFDYLTVQDPQSDYLPNVEPFGYSFLTPGQMPVPVSNDGGTAADPNDTAKATVENAAPLHGLININTASWRVLSAINWTPFPVGSADRDRYHLQPRTPDGEYEFVDGGNGVDDNLEIAKAIVWWRDGKDEQTQIPIFGAPPNQSGGPVGPKGPFRSIYDLYRVYALHTYYFKLAQTTSGLLEPDDVDGDFSPYNGNPDVMPTGTMAATDEVRYDFEERYQLISRVSNLITTRSDSFTVYIVVQGWRNVNSTDPSVKPELVVQRRAAFIADRSGVTATGGSLKITSVASE